MSLLTFKCSRLKRKAFLPPKMFSVVFFPMLSVICVESVTVRNQGEETVGRTVVLKADKKNETEDFPKQIVHTFH